MARKTSDPSVLCVEKRELPLPLIVKGEDGRFEVQSIEPAGAKKLGARIGRPAEWMIAHVRRLMGR